MTTELAFQPGDRCGQYKIVDLLSAGGIGEVYRAEQQSVGRQVAIKVLQFRLANREDMQARMAMEGQALGRISHPNMVTVFDAGCTEKGMIWIAMELLVGETLRHILNERGQLEVVEAVACAVDVAEAVGAAHREGIIHRDIKPENIFITEHGTVKVLDLGTAKLQGWGGLKTTEKGRILGTPAYMSPEQIRCIRLDERSDIYALGVMLYEMIAGHPFAHLVNLTDHYQLARMHLFGEVRPLSTLSDHVPDRLEAVVRRSMEKDPDRRYASILEFANDLRTVTGLASPLMRGSVRPVLKPPSMPPLGPRGTLRIPEESLPLRPAPRSQPPKPSPSAASQSPSMSGPFSSPGTLRTGERAPLALWVVAILIGGLMGSGVGGAILFWPQADESVAVTQPAPTTTAVASARPSAPDTPDTPDTPEAREAPAAVASAPPAKSLPTHEPVVRTPLGTHNRNRTQLPRTSTPPRPPPSNPSPPDFSSSDLSPSNPSKQPGPIPRMRDMPTSGL